MTRPESRVGRIFLIVCPFSFFSPSNLYRCSLLITRWRRSTRVSVNGNFFLLVFPFSFFSPFIFVSLFLLKSVRRICISVFLLKTLRLKFVSLFSAWKFRRKRSACVSVIFEFLILNNTSQGLEFSFPSKIL